jgi:hypothetical protein
MLTVGCLTGTRSASALTQMIRRRQSPTKQAAINDLDRSIIPCETTAATGCCYFADESLFSLPAGNTYHPDRTPRYSRGASGQGVERRASWLLRRLRGQHSCKYQHADFRQLYTWVLKYIAVRLRHYRFPGFESGASRAYSPLRCPLKLHILKVLPTQCFLRISSFDKSIPF